MGKGEEASHIEATPTRRLREGKKLKGGQEGVDEVVAAKGRMEEDPTGHS